MVDTNQNSKYSAQVNGTLGTTASSNLPGCYIDVDSDNTTYTRLLESTAVRSGFKGNFYSHGLDPNDSTRLIVSIHNSEKTAVVPV